ncbi:MAG TPA: hypothetical protein VFK38_06905 [Candidatus Limnocylindrales bacterium]|nr:hypothetical protein [Candidatus Limnocylindrales bacterium]
MSRLGGGKGLLVLLGGGVFVAVAIGAVRALRKGAAASGHGSEPESESSWTPVPSPATPGPAPLAPAPRSLASSAVRDESADEPPPSVAESVLPHAREPEAVVESLVPPELAHRANVRLDLLVAAVVIAVALVAVFLIGRALA